MGKVRNAISLIIVLPVFAILELVAMIVGWGLRALKQDRAADLSIHFILGMLVAWIALGLGIRVHVEGKEHIPEWGTPVVFCPDHNSIADIPVLYQAGMWCGLVAKQELFKIPLLHGLLKLLKCLPLDRSSVRAGLKTIMAGIEQLKTGYAMGIFPEGTRSKDGHLQEMKAGAFKMATKVGAPVVPVAIKNTRYCFENAVNLRLVHVYVRILPPIKTEGMSREEQILIPDMVYNGIKQAMEELPGPYGRKA